MDIQPINLFKKVIKYIIIYLMTKRNFDEAFNKEIDHSNQLKKNKTELSYYKYITNNFHRINFYKFGYCIFCKNKVQANLVRNICDTSTVMCYHCSSSMVVPGECNRQTLQQWYNEAFNL